METWHFLTFGEIAITRSREHEKVPSACLTLTVPNDMIRIASETQLLKWITTKSNKPEEDNPSLLDQVGANPRPAPLQLGRECIHPKTMPNKNRVVSIWPYFSIVSLPNT